MCLKTTRLICFSVLLLSCSRAAAQRQYVPETIEPRTRLEALQFGTGAVIVRGSQRVGVARGQGQGQVGVTALEVIDTSNSQKARGIALTVEEGGEHGREITAFIDYDELEGLIKGFESMSRLDRAESQLPNFEASYRTKGDLVISVFGTRGGVTRCVVAAGWYEPAKITLPAEGAETLRSLLTAAKNRLDEARAR
jgi:hypothetical protein